jgi:glucan biosynthesis protein C
MANERQTPRLFFIDNLRITLIVLVIAHHAGQAYGPGGWWYFENPVRASILGAFFTVNRSFFMSLFFMISGYFLPMSYDRKGARDFLRDRLRRLGYPLLVFFFAVFPVMMYVYYLNFRHYGPLPFLVYYSQVYFGRGIRPADWTGPSWPDMTLGHLWFIEHLLIFAVCYALWRLINRPRAIVEGREWRLPRNLEIIAFILALAAVTFVVRIWYPIDKWVPFLRFIQVAFADVPRDLSFFIIGVVAYRRNWFLNMSKKTGKVWLLLGLAAAGLCYGLNLTGHMYFSAGGLNVQSVLYDLWEAFLCSGLCIGLLVLFREKLNSQGALAKNLAASTYAAYLFHVPILVFLQYAVRHVAAAAIVKFAIVTLAAIPLTFLFSSYIRRFPLVRRII